MRSGKKTIRKISFSGCSNSSSKRTSTASQPSFKDLADAQRVGLDGQGRVRAAGGRHERAVGDVEVLKLPAAVVAVEYRILRVGAEARAAEHVVGDPRDLAADGAFAVEAHAGAGVAQDLAALVRER